MRRLGLGADHRVMQSEQSKTAQRADVDVLVHRHLPLVAHAFAEIAGRLPHEVDRADLLAAGFLGLLEAARASAQTTDEAFVGVATSCIRRAVVDELRQVPWPARRLPTIRADIAAVSERLEPGTSTAHIAYDMGVDRDWLTRLANAHCIPAVETVSSVGDSASRETSHGDALAQLPGRLRFVLIALFFDGRTVAQVAEDLGVSEAQVGDLRSEGLALLRGDVRSEQPPAQVGHAPRRAVVPSTYAAAATVSDARAARDSAAADVADRIALSTLTG